MLFIKLPSIKAKVLTWPGWLGVQGLNTDGYLFCWCSASHSISTTNPVSKPFPSRKRASHLFHLARCSQPAKAQLIPTLLWSRFQVSSPQLTLPSELTTLIVCSNSFGSQHMPDGKVCRIVASYYFFLTQ